MSEPTDPQSPLAPEGPPAPPEREGFDEFPPAEPEPDPRQAGPLIVLQMGTPATIFLTLGNIGVFLAMVVLAGSQALLDPSIATLMKWGANFGPLTATSQPWRMFTSMFLHAGLIHIAFNMYALWQLGRLVERFYGTPRFVVIYLLSGLAGSCSSLIFHPVVVGVGASGAIFGVLGALLSYTTLQRAGGGDPRYKRMQSSVINCIILNLILGFSIPHIDNSAHLGGLTYGILAGFVVAPIPVPGFALNARARSVIGSVLLALVLGGVVPLARYMAVKNPDVKAELVREHYFDYIATVSPQFKEMDALEKELFENSDSGVAKARAQELAQRADAVVKALSAQHPTDAKVAALHQIVLKDAHLMADATHALEQYAQSGAPSALQECRGDLVQLHSVDKEFTDAVDAYTTEIGIKPHKQPDDKANQSNGSGKP